MQLSAANLLIAAQQPVRANAPDAQAQFATALVRDGRVDANFEPIEFKSAAPAKSAAGTVAKPLLASPYGSAGLGAHIDIRV